MIRYHLHAALLAGLALNLSGCSLWQSQPEPVPPSLPVVSQPETIASHRFELQPSQHLVGALATVNAEQGDTLSDMARHYGLGFSEITQANADVDPWIPQPQQPVLLPLRFILPQAPHKGIVLNLASMRLFYYPRSAGDTVQTYPVGIGRDNWNTPLGQTHIAAKKANPDWVVPPSIRREHQQKGEPLPGVVPAGPDNPLGQYAMPLALGKILIHGTNKPYGIGMQVSHGCIQMYPEDIEQLYEQVAVGTPVTIVHQSYLATWQGNALYLEAHPPLQRWASQDRQARKRIREQLSQLASQQGVKVDWHKVDDILQQANGVPQPVQIGAATDIAPIALRHPDHWLNQPETPDITSHDWTLQFAAMADQGTAQKLSAMLNHLDSPIPARTLSRNGEYQVVAGPFKSAQQTQATAKRIAKVFEMTATAIPPSQP